MKARALLLLAAAALSLTACGPDPIDPRRQIGAHPYLPDIHQYLLPPMKLARVTGWNGAKPTVAAGLKVSAFATGLKSPRMVYVLPNGDVLVVESEAPPSGGISRPKEFIMGIMMSMSHSQEKAGNRILLLRDANGDGVPETKTVFLDHLKSPFGVVLVGNDLYVANADAVMRYPYQTGETQITDPGTELTPLPGGPINHHWTKSLTASADGTKL
jgi:glucose/arabinose dehydrogenase